MSLSTATKVETARLIDQAFGHEILACMRDPEVEDVFINSNGRCFARFSNRKIRLKTILSDAARAGIIGYAGTLIGQKADGINRFAVDGKLPSGQRFHGVIAPRAVGGAYIVMRNPPRKVYTLGQYVDDGVMTMAVADGLEKVLSDDMTTLINGTTGAGKTSLLTCLVNHPARNDRRTAVLEDSQEVNTDDLEDCIVKSTIGGTMDDLLFDAMRERPDRIIIGELRDMAAWSFIKAIETGHDGSMSTTHADQPHNAMGRIERLCAEKLGEAATTQRELLIEMIRRIVPIKLLPNGKRFVPGIFEPVRFFDGRYQVSTVCGESF